MRVGDRVLSAAGPKDLQPMEGILGRSRGHPIERRVALSVSDNASLLRSEGLRQALQLGVHL